MTSLGGVGGSCNGAGEAARAKCMKSICRSNVFLVQRLEMLFKPETATVSTSVYDGGCRTLIKLYGSIFECEATGKGQLDRLVGG